MSRSIHPSVSGTLLLLGALVAACGGGTPPASSPGAAASSATSAGVASADPLGPRPEPQAPTPWEPPSPTVFKTPAGLTVWLLERHTLPMVAVSVAVPTGSTSDPKGREGLAHATADMLDEGAGNRGALELARVIDQYGASLHAAAAEDFSVVELSVLKRNFTPALGVLADVVMRPRFEDGEWRRTKELWINALRQRARDPEEVASVVATVALAGRDNPYGHPVEGFVASAAQVQLSDVRSFFASAYRPDRAVIVVAGDVTRSELEPALDTAFHGWKVPITPAATLPTAPSLTPTTRFVLVDRPDAPQSVISVVRVGARASDSAVPPLGRVNKALGGSFTSRLNQDLREEHGWTYGAHSRISAYRATGTVLATAAVVTEKTGAALRAMLADIDAFARDGLTAEEVAKTRLQLRMDVVHQYEGVQGAAHRLARNAALALAPDYERMAAELRDGADRALLTKLAATYFDRSAAVVVVVGPKEALTADLPALGLGDPELRDTDGMPVKSAAPSSAAPPSAAATGKATPASTSGAGAPPAPAR